MHKSYTLAVFGGLLMLVASSCAPIYRCGDPIPEKIPGGKRMRAVVLERDDLCRNLAVSEADNAQLTANLNQSTDQNQALNKEYDELRGLYDGLRDENVSQAQQFSTALRQKSDELNNKERLLAERENALREMQEIIERQDSITRNLNDIVRNALLGFNPDELTVEVRNGKVYVSMSDKLLFRSGSADVEQKGRQAIQVLGEVLNKNTEIDVLVEGHTDNVPIRTSRFRDNWDLSVVRATSIVRILTDEHNISPQRVTASGKGEFMPRASNETAETRALNRRTEIILSPKLDELMKILNAT
jgi:chemotaxis protein MotB